MIMFEVSLDANSCGRWHVDLDSDSCQNLNLLAQFERFAVNVCNNVRNISYEKHVDRYTKEHPYYGEDVLITMLDADVSEAYSSHSL